MSEPAPAPQPTEATDTVRMPVEFASRVKRIVGVVIAKTGRRFGAADVFEVNRESFEAWLAQVEAWAEGLE